MRLASLVCLAAAVTFPRPAARAADQPAPVYNLTLRIDSTPDLTDISSYLKSITSQYSNPQDQAIARLAYAYRVLLAQPTTARYVRVTSPSQKGWGTLLSEIQVFDRVTVDRNVPPEVVLPKLSSP